MLVDNSILFGGFSILILIILFFYIMSLNKRIDRQLKLYERSIENINKNIFKLEKRLDSVITKEEVEEFLYNELDDIKDPIYKSLKEIKQAVESTRANIENRVDNIEERSKEYMAIPMSASLDEGRVVSLFKSGYAVDEIAKEMRANINEVSFVLKLKGLI